MNKAQKNNLLPFQGFRGKTEQMASGVSANSGIEEFMAMQVKSS